MATTMPHPYPIHDWEMVETYDFLRDNVALRDIVAADSGT